MSKDTFYAYFKKCHSTLYIFFEKCLNQFKLYNLVSFQLAESQNGPAKINGQCKYHH